jgi:hypothetical protein
MDPMGYGSIPQFFVLAALWLFCGHSFFVYRPRQPVAMFRLLRVQLCPKRLSAAGSELIDLQVIRLSGEVVCTLRVNDFTLGWEVRRMVSEQLPAKGGAKLVLHHGAEPLLLQHALKEQGIRGEAATLSCTCVPTNLCAAWSYVKGLAVCEEEIALEGVTQIAGNMSNESLHHLPRSLQILTLGHIGYLLNEKLDGVYFPSSLPSLTLADDFNQRLDRVTFPSSLHSLTFGCDFNQRLNRMTSPSGLQILTFGDAFDQSLDGVSFPSCLQSLTFGYDFNQSLVNKGKLTAADDAMKFRSITGSNQLAFVHHGTEFLFQAVFKT